MQDFLTEKDVNQVLNIKSKAKKEYDDFMSNNRAKLEAKKKLRKSILILKIIKFIILGVGAAISLEIMMLPSLLGNSTLMTDLTLSEDTLWVSGLSMLIAVVVTFIIMLAIQKKKEGIYNREYKQLDETMQKLLREYTEAEKNFKDYSAALNAKKEAQKAKIEFDQLKSITDDNLREKVLVFVGRRFGDTKAKAYANKKFTSPSNNKIFIDGVEIGSAQKPVTVFLTTPGIHSIKAEIYHYVGNIGTTSAPIIDECTFNTNAKQFKIDNDFKAFFISITSYFPDDKASLTKTHDILITEYSDVESFLRASNPDATNAELIEIYEDIINGVYDA